MARLFTSGAELKDLTAIGITKVGTGTDTYDTGTVRSGLSSFKYDSTASNLAVGHKFSFTGALDVTYFARIAVRFPAFTASDQIFFFVTNANNGPRLLITSTGTIKLDDGLGLVGTSSAISVNIWHYLEVEWKTVTGGGTTGTVKAKLDGTQFASKTTSNLGSAGATAINWGWPFVSPGASKVIFADDVCLNDDTGANQNTYPGDGKIVALLPESDNAVGANWTGGAGGTTNLWDAVDNTPPTGTATETDTTQIEHSGGANNSYDANLTTYTAAGVGGSDTITLAQLVAIHGEDVATGTKLLAFSVVSNPAISSSGNVTAGNDAGALGTYPSLWTVHRGTVTYAPSVTVGTAPVMRANRPETVSRVASVAFMGLLVEYVPGAAGTIVSPPAATATADALAPTVRVTVAVPVATATAAAVAPASLFTKATLTTATGSAQAPTVRTTVQAPLATAAAAPLTPTNQAVAALPVATATGTSPTPTVRVVVLSPVATATGDAPAPTVQSAAGQTNVVVPLATATVAGIAPTIIASAAVPLAIATGQASVPTELGVVAVPAAVSTATALSPTTQAIVAVPVATATGDALVPTVVSAAGGGPAVFDSIGAAFQYANSTNVAPTVPATVNAGDFLACYISHRDAGVSISSFPSGWAYVPTQAGSINPVGTGTEDPCIMAAYKIADGSEGGTTPAFTLSAAGNGVAAIARYTGNDPTTPFDADAVSNVMGAASTAIPVPQLTTATNGALVIVFVGGDEEVTSANQFTSWPASLTERADMESGTSNVFLGVADVEMPTAGTFNGSNGTVTATSDTWATLDWALKPAPGGGGATTVLVPVATATGDTLTPTILALIIVPAAVVTGNAATPTIQAISTVPAATASAAAVDSTQLVVVSVPVATASGSAPTPTLPRLPLVATAIGDAPTPTVRGIVAAPAASATGAAFAPTVLGGAERVQPPAATATGDALASTTLLRTLPPLATVAAAAGTPTVQGLVSTLLFTATGNALASTNRLIVQAPTATATGNAPAPILPRLVPLATATAAAAIPTLRAVIAVPVAAASGMSLAPSIQSGAGVIQIPTATASGQAATPTLRLITAAPTATVTGTGLDSALRLIVPATAAVASGLAVAPSTRFVILPPTGAATGTGFASTSRATISAAAATATGQALVPNIIVGPIIAQPLRVFTVATRETLASEGPVTLTARARQALTANGPEPLAVPGHIAVLTGDHE